MIWFLVLRAEEAPVLKPSFYLYHKLLNKIE